MSAGDRAMDEAITAMMNEISSPPQTAEAKWRDRALNAEEDKKAFAERIAELFDRCKQVEAQRNDLLALLGRVLPIAAERVDEEAQFMETEADHDDHRVRLATIQEARAAITQREATA